MNLEEATIKMLKESCNKDVKKAEETSNEREEAINKLMKSSGLSREEVLKIVNQIK